MTCRRAANIWSCVIRPRLFYWGIFKSEYFWQDSFLTYLNRWIVCPLFGHQKIDLVDGYCTDEPTRPFCFACYSDVKKWESENGYYWFSYDNHMIMAYNNAQASSRFEKDLGHPVKFDFEGPVTDEEMQKCLLISESFAEKGRKKRKQKTRYKSDDRLVKK